MWDSKVDNRHALSPMDKKNNKFKIFLSTAMENSHALFLILVRTKEQLHDFRKVIY